MTTWTEERMKTALDMWNAGRSATEIACALGGVSRNAVLGKIHRMDVARGEEAVRHVRRKQAVAATERNRSAARPKPRPRPKPVEAAKPVPTATKVPDPVPEDDAPVVYLGPPDVPRRTLVELGKCQCHWPVEGTGAAALFCAAATVGTKPYCSYHAQQGRGLGTRTEQIIGKMIRKGKRFD